MSEDPIDFGALDPTADVESWERLIQGVMERTTPQLERYAVPRSPLLMLAGWARPTLAAAAALAAVSLGVLTLGVPSSTVPVAHGGVEALGLPAPVGDWVAEDRGPTAEDLLIAMEGGMP